MSQTAVGATVCSTATYDGFGRTALQSQGASTVCGTTQKSSTAYVYDGLDRVQKVTTTPVGGSSPSVYSTWWSYDGFTSRLVGQAGAATGATNNPSGTVTTAYQLNPDGAPVAVSQTPTGGGTPVVSWLNKTAQGSVTSLSATGSTSASCTVNYDPFGNPQAAGPSTPLPGPTAGNSVCTQASSTANTVWFDSSPRDPSYGTYQLGARTYNPATASFTTPDTNRVATPAQDLSVGTDPLTANTYTYVNGNPINLSDPDGHRPVDEFGNTMPYCDWHQCSQAQQRAGQTAEANYRKRVADEGRTERIAELDHEIQAAQIDYLSSLIPSDTRTKDLWRTEGLAALDSGDPKQVAAYLRELRTWFTAPPHGSCAASPLCIGVIGAASNPFTYVPDPSACIGANSNAGGCALQLASIVPIGKLARLRVLVDSAKDGSTLARASSAAFDAASDSESMFIKNKHLLSASGNGAKFITDDIGQVQEWIASGLLSDGVRFLPNQLDDTFRAIVPAGQVVGTRGETFIRVIVSYDGRVINAFPVNVQ